MSSNFMLSVELIYLLEWLLKHEKSRLRTIIKKAAESGLAHKIDKLTKPQASVDNEHLQDAFLEFLVFLEHTLIDTLEESESDQSLRANLTHTFHRLPLASVDPQAAMSSLHDAQVALEKNAHKKAEFFPTEDEMAQTLLGKYLKNWKPSKEDLVN